MAHAHRGGRGLLLLIVFGIVFEQFADEPSPLVVLMMLVAAALGLVTGVLIHKLQVTNRVQLAIRVFEPGT